MVQVPAMVHCALVAPRFLRSAAHFVVFLVLVAVVVVLLAIGTGSHTGACGGTGSARCWFADCTLAVKLGPRNASSSQKQ